MNGVDEMLESMRRHREELDAKNNRLFVRLQSALQVAELKHPVFATSFEEGMMRILEEAGEVAQASNKMAGEKRKSEELLDLLCVIWRMVRGDWDDVC